MVQARGIMLRENVKTIGHMIRLYTNKNTTLNGTGKIACFLLHHALFLLLTFVVERSKPDPSSCKTPVKDEGISYHVYWEIHLLLGPDCPCFRIYKGVLTEGMGILYKDTGLNSFLLNLILANIKYKKQRVLFQFTFFSSP